MCPAPAKPARNSTAAPATLPAPTDSARAAGLRYVYDTRPGITRHRTRAGFRYTTPDGHALRDKETLARIKSLVIPPAWKQVWICRQPNGHLQATGRDDRGREAIHQ